MTSKKLNKVRILYIIWAYSDYLSIALRITVLVRTNGIDFINNSIARVCMDVKFSLPTNFVILNRQLRCCGNYRAGFPCYVTRICRITRTS